MCFHKSRFARISAIIIAGLAFLILISAVIVSEVIIPGEIHSYIKEVSKGTPYRVEVKEITFDFLHALNGEEIQIFNPTSLTNPILKIENITVKPEIISSLINRKMEIREIIVDNPVVSFTEEGLDSLVKLIREKEEERETKKEKPFPIEIERVRINNAHIEIAHGILIRSKKIEVDLSALNLKEERTIKLSGSINIQNYEIEISGEIKPFQDKTTGELKMNLSDLNTHSFSNAPLLPKKLGVSLDSKFQISDRVTSQGVVDFRPPQTEGEKFPPSFGNLKYDLTYDNSTDTAFVNSLILKANELTQVSFAGRVEKLRREAIFKLEGEAQDIQLEGISHWFPNLSHIRFSGMVEPTDIRVTGSIRDKDVSLTGRAVVKDVSVKDTENGSNISGLKGRFNFRRTFRNSASDGFSAQGNLSLSDASTEIFNVNRVSGNIEFVSSENGISLRSKGLYYEGFSFNKVLVEDGNVSRLEFNLGRDWTLKIYSTGSRFKVLDEGIYIKRLQTDFRIEKGINVWGSFRGREGRYKDISFPNISANFRLNNNIIRFTNLEMEIGGYGELEAEKLNFLFRDQKPYALMFTQGSFSGFDQKVRSKEIKGEFRFNAGDGKNPGWDGDVFVSEADIFKSLLKNLSLHISPSSDGINLERISGRFLDSDLQGNIRFKTAESPPLVSSEIELRRISVLLNKLALSLDRLNVNFKGRLEKGLLPQGSGTISSDLKLGQDKPIYPLSGQMEIQSIGETLILKDGFIENGKGATIHFTGRLEDLLSANRKVQFNLPEAPLASIQGIIYPILPAVLREGEVTGNMSLNLVFVPSTKEETFWDGKLSLRNISLNAKLSEVPFLIKDLDGTITLTGEIELKNPLDSSIRMYSRPDKKAFAAALSILTQEKAENKVDILNIKEISYGFLRLEDIEFALGLDRDKLNLRRFESKLYGGNVFGAGLFEFDGKEPKYDFSFLFKDISLHAASDSVSPTNDYITGRMNGIGWLSDRGGRLSTLDGSFNFWTIKSKKEPRRVGRALLEQLGVKEKFFLRSSRRYDEGEVYGYIKDGAITFKGLSVIHSILGIKDLRIQVDQKRNSISVAHFLSVIRETAKRASEGRLKIEFKK
jgi:hypothetical protein